MKKVLFWSAAVLAASMSALSAKIYFTGTCDKDALSYKCGEPMVFSVSLKEDGKALDGKKVRYIRSGDDGVVDEGTFVSDANKPFVYKTSIDKAGYVRLRMILLDDKGMPVKDADKYEGGACADFDKLEQATPEPKDFDKYWKARKRALKKVPMEAKLTPFPCPQWPNVEFYTFEITSLGDPVKGYLCIPKGAKEKSLPAAAVFGGYGVYDMHHWPVGGQITIFVSAHSIEMGREKAFYDDLDKGALKGFGFEKELAKPQDSYFDKMLLRDLRALEYIRTRPEWNGKDLSVSGGSMGGFQAVAMAALDKKVTDCRSGITWMCDISGNDHGRLNGWRPKYLPARGYFDSVNFAKRIKCPVRIDAGLGDYVCPPSGVSILYNNITAPKQITFTQGRTHTYKPAESPATYVRSNGIEK